MVFLSRESDCSNESSLTGVGFFEHSLSKPVISSELVDIMLGVAVSCLSLLGIIGNCIAVYVIRRVLRMRSARTTRADEQGVVVVFLNLAICDLSISLLVMPFTAAVLFNGREMLLFETDLLNKLLCNVSGVVFNLASRTSVFLILYISVTRALVMGFPFMKKCWKSRMNNKIIISTCWLAAAIISIIPFFFGKEYVYIPIVASCQYRLSEIYEPQDDGEHIGYLYVALVVLPICLPGIIIFLSSFVVILKLYLNSLSYQCCLRVTRSTCLEKTKIGRTVEVKAMLREGQPRTRGSAIQTLILIIIAFVLCYLSYWTVALEQLLEILGVVRCNLLFSLFGGENHLSHHYIYLLPSVILLFLNCILNPVVYYFQGSRFKGALPWRKSTVEKCNFHHHDDRLVRRKIRYTDVIIQFSHTPQRVTSCLWVDDNGKRLSLTDKIHEFAANRRQSMMTRELEAMRSAEEAIFEEAFGSTCSTVVVEMDKVNFLDRLKSSGEIDIVERDCPEQPTYPKTSKHANKKMSNAFGHQYPRPRSLRLRMDPFVPHEREGNEPFPSECREKTSHPPKNQTTGMKSLPRPRQEISKPPPAPSERERHSIAAIPMSSKPPTLLPHSRQHSSPVLTKSQKTPQTERRLSLAVLQPRELKLSSLDRSPGGTSPNTTPMKSAPPSPLVMPYKRNNAPSTTATSSKSANKAKSSNKLETENQPANSKVKGAPKRRHFRPRGKPMKLVVIEDPRRSLGACPELEEEQSIIFNPNDLKISNF
ncbi:uncharacterized protein LOC134821955 isoform X2 [Bolinopsis microptera]|uniref:uncharacterized protein LOC134821955 isoform X2 n=1 Tax=Bolinopsis microptera TaxID=2820187 RepID=UPI003078FF66